MAGAGASGLISAKCLLDEGFEVTVYEQEPHLGGLWRYGDSTDGTSLRPITSHCIAPGSSLLYVGHSGCYRSLRTLSTKRMTSFRDHPIEEWMSRKETKSLVAKLRASASPWAHHSQIFAYLEVPHARQEAATCPQPYHGSQFKPCVISGLR